MALPGIRNVKMSTINSAIDHSYHVKQVRVICTQVACPIRREKFCAWITRTRKADDFANQSAHSHFKAEPIEHVHEIGSGLIWRECPEWRPRFRESERLKATANDCQILLVIGNKQSPANGCCRAYRRGQVTDH